MNVLHAAFIPHRKYICYVFMTAKRAKLSKTKWKNRKNHPVEAKTKAQVASCYNIYKIMKYPTMFHKYLFMCVCNGKKICRNRPICSSVCRTVNN